MTRRQLNIYQNLSFLRSCLSIFLTALCLPAFADSFDMTTLNPVYETIDGTFLNGVSPNYSVSVSPSSLTLTGEPNLPNNLGQYENTTFPLTTGDFLASVTLTISSNSGGFFNVTSNSGYFGLNRNNDGVWANYGFGSGNVNTPTIPISTTTVTYTLSRVGDDFNAYVLTGAGYVNVVSLTGPSVSGAMGISMGVRGVPGIDSSETTTFQNFSFSTVVSPDLTSFYGGSASGPVMLPATPVSSISASIGSGEPDADYYSFYWKGGYFSASVGVPDASAILSPPSYSFELCDGSSCQNVIEATVADSTNSWSSSLSGDLTAGMYTIGIAELSGTGDPMFTIDFANPISQIVTIPELSTWAMMFAGFAGLGFLGYRATRRAA